MKVVGYPCLLCHDCRLFILTESLASIMHYASIIVLGPKGIDGLSAVLVEVVLRAWEVFKILELECIFYVA